MNIILYLLRLIQQLYHHNCFLINFICKYIPLKQWAFDDSHSPKLNILALGNHASGVMETGILDAETTLDWLNDHQ